MAAPVGYSNRIYTDQHAQKNLTDIYRSEVMKFHGRTAKKLFFRDLEQGKSDAVIYHGYLTNLYKIYSELESGVLYCAEKDCRFKNLIFPELFRKASLETDLADKRFNGIISYPSTATNEYVAYLENLKNSNPARFLSNWYARCIGDLSAAKIFQAQVDGKFPGAFYDFKELLNKHKIEGDIYHFTDPTDNYIFRDEIYKKQIDAVHWSESERQDFINEMKMTFEQFDKIFEALIPQSNEIASAEGQQNLLLLGSKA